MARNDRKGDEMCLAVDPSRGLRRPVEAVLEPVDRTVPLLSRDGRAQSSRSRVLAAGREDRSGVGHDPAPRWVEIDA